MSQSRVEIKVGVFLLFGLVLLAALALLFSRDLAFYRDQYQLQVKSGNVGGLKTGAKVLVRGIEIGRVSRTQLDADGQSVTILLRIDSRYQILDNARFEIEQSGFLGDQFVAIYPGTEGGQPLQDGDTVQAAEPFNMQEAVAAATEAISKISLVSSNLNAAVTDVRQLVLTERTLTNLAETLDRFSELAANAQTTVNNLNTLVTANTAPVAETVSNLNAFASQLPPLASYVQSLVSSNGAELSAALKNLETGSETLTNLLAGLQAGEGVAGRLLRDEQMAANLASIAHNLAITTSNLNTRGLWGIMWKQKPPKPAPTK